MHELNDIFGSNKQKLSDEELLKYLDEHASEQEKHTVEKALEDSEFEKEALEGLQQFRNKEQLPKDVSQLNKKLHQQLDQRKRKKERRQVKELPVAVITVVLILALCVLAYLVLHLLHRA